jgi:uncharacterized protein
VSAVELLQPYREDLARLCQRYAVRRVAVFGSAIAPDFDPARSDLDLVVQFSPSSELSPARQYFDFKSELEKLFGRTVDIVELAAMPGSRLKRIIERSQVQVYDEPA